MLNSKIQLARNLQPAVVFYIMWNTKAKHANKKYRSWVGGWYIRALLDQVVSMNPEWRSGIIFKELARYNELIFLHSETRVSDENQLIETVNR